MRHLGGIGFLLFWILAGSGFYLFARLDTSAAGAYASIDGLEWWLGGVLRSVHRHAADAFVIVALAHLVREALAGRFRGFRAFSWISGVPLLWLLYASGVVGYWLVWDSRSHFSFQATLETVGLGAAVTDAPDRLFSLFLFLHIGLPLALLAAMWVHVQRLGMPRTGVPRSVAAAFALVLLSLALLRPAASQPPWDPGSTPQGVAVDWFFQFVHPLLYATSAGTVIFLVLGATALLVLLPALSRAVSRPTPIAAAVVDPANCNGCGRCVADCPYEAVMLAKGKAEVLAARCAACGICAGACPSSTPFRSLERLVSGIELPDLRLDGLRERLRAALRTGREHIVFRCDNAPGPADAISMRCVAMLPPAFVEYALRNGAHEVRVLGCEDECAFRLGIDLADGRFTRQREPRLRANVRAERTGNAFTFALR